LNSAAEASADFYILDKPVSANFVIDCQGHFADSRGSSRGISNDVDRNHLSLLRRQADAIVTGGATARVEKYAPSTQYVTYVFTTQELVPGLIARRFGNGQRLVGIFGDIASSHAHVLVEAGPKLLKQLFAENLIDTLFLTVTHLKSTCMCLPEDAGIIRRDIWPNELLGLPKVGVRRTTTINGTVLTRVDLGEPQTSS